MGTRKSDTTVEGIDLSSNGTKEDEGEDDGEVMNLSSTCNKEDAGEAMGLSSACNKENPDFSSPCNEEGVAAKEGSHNFLISL